MMQMSCAPFVPPQVQLDLAQMQLTHSSERTQTLARQQQLAAHQQQLERALADAQAARAGAEARARDTEQQLADMRGALNSQERLLLVLREQVAEGGEAAARAGELEGQVQVSSLIQHRAGLPGRLKGRNRVGGNQAGRDEGGPGQASVSRTASGLTMSYGLHGLITGRSVTRGGPRGACDEDHRHCWCFPC